MKFPNLAWALARRRVPHYEAAVGIGMGESKFSRAMNGRNAFTAEERQKIADFLRYQVEWLFQEVSPPVDCEAQALRSVGVNP